MTRLEALQAAGDFVAGVLASKNERGYPSVNMGAAERLDYTIKVAEFLLEGESSSLPPLPEPAPVAERRRGPLALGEDEW